MPHKDIKGFPSVTQIIDTLDKPFLRFWYGKLGTAECERIKRESQEFGTAVHDGIENYLRGSKDKLKDPIKACVESFKGWHKESGFTATHIEPDEPVKSVTYRYQGTYDAIGYFKDRPDTLVVADWKTSKQSDDKFGLQLSAYAYAFGESQGWSEEKTWQALPSGLIVRIDKETYKAHEHRFDHLQYYFEVFKSLILPYQFLNKTGAWEKPEKFEGGI